MIAREYPQLAARSCRPTRLAVTLATQPDAKVRRALATSILWPSTGVPTASTLTTGEVDQADDHVDVVDHQIEDHVDLDAAILPRRDAIALEIERIDDDLGERLIGAREALDMADLEHEFALLGEVGERSRARDAIGDRLLDEDVHASADERVSDVVMKRRRHRHAHRIDSADDARDSRTAARRRTPAATALARSALGVDHGDSLARGLRE